jgi:transcription-repair coupling factor (superfamily II helicase)
LDKLKEELVDRCGPLPEPVHLLFEAAQLRSQAKEKGISEVHQEQESIRILFKSQHRLSDKQLNTLLALGSDKLQFLPGSPNGIRFYIKGAESGLSSLKRFLELMS